MGKKKGGACTGSSNTKPPPAPVKYQPAALRQQSERPGGPAAAAVTTTTQGLNPSTQARALRVDHLLRVATWASANAPPLGALLGARLGDLCESAGVPVPDSPHSICERCESVMQVGENCSVRVTKSKRGRRPSKHSNGVTTTCHMCTHENVRPGTLKTHLKTKLAQAAARLNLNLLGKSSVAKQQALSLNLVNQKQQQQGLVVGEERSVQVCLENLQGVTHQQEGSKTVEVTLDMETLDVLENNQCEQEAGKPVEVALNEAPLDHSGTNNEQGFVEQEAGKPVEVALNEAPLDHSGTNNEQGFVEQEGGEPVEVTLTEAPLDHTGANNEQGFVEQEEGATTVDLIFNTRPLDLLEKEQLGFAEQEGGEPVEVSLNEPPLDHTGKKNEKGLTQPEDLKSLTGGTSVSRLPLDLSSKKKRKKKNQQGGGVVEQEGLIRNTTSGKGFAVESSDSSARKKKCKGWSTLKELASLP